MHASCTVSIFIFSQSHTTGIEYNPCTRTSRVQLYKCEPTVNDIQDYPLQQRFPRHIHSKMPNTTTPSIRSHSVLLAIKSDLSKEFYTLKPFKRIPIYPHERIRKYLLPKKISLLTLLKSSKGHPHGVQRVVLQRG